MTERIDYPQLLLCRCGAQTRGQKSACLEHVAEIPYAASVVAGREQLAREVEDAQQGRVDPRGVLASDVLSALALGPRTAAGVRNEVGSPAAAIRAVLAGLRSAGLVAFDVVRRRNGSRLAIWRLA